MRRQTDSLKLVVLADAETQGFYSSSVILANAGIQKVAKNWIPAFAGMTRAEWTQKAMSFARRPRECGDPEVLSFARRPREYGDPEVLSFARRPRECGDPEVLSFARHPRECGDPEVCKDLDSRLRGNDDKRREL